MSNPLSRTQQELIDRVNDQCGSIAKLRDKELVSFADSLRENFFSRSFDSRSQSISVLALAKEAIRRTLGWQLYDVQLVTADALIGGNIAEMQTGEGKTLATLPAAMFWGLQGCGAHVSTPNPYLAERDFRLLAPVYESVGLSVGVLEEQGDSKRKKIAYDAEITYGPGYEFGFDYLRDQMILKGQSELPLGRHLLGQIAGAQPEGRSTVGRRQAFAIVDEADNVLIDDASSPLVISEFQAGEAEDSDAVLLARKVALSLSLDEDFRDHGQARIELTSKGQQKIYRDDIPIPVEQLCRSWASYVETALRAERFYQRDAHYVITENKVQIVDGSTGRIFSDRTWQSGLHQAVEGKEGLSISPEKIPLARITRQRFYRLYSGLSGLTGTAANCRTELKSVYDLGVSTIPLRVPSARQTYPLRAFSSAEKKWQMVVESIVQQHQHRRPVLIGTRTIAESVILADLLRAGGLPFELLNGMQDSDEAGIVEGAGQQGSITIATNLAGRGTDIKLGPGVKELGGLHVIVSECHESTRVDRQLIGRCARQGDPGSSQTFISADDWLLVSHAQWLSNAIRNAADRMGECSIPLERNIKRIQLSRERVHFAARSAMLEQERKQEKLLSV